MALQTRDLYCENCGERKWNSATEFGQYGSCDRCGGAMRVTWEAGQPPATDVYGCPQYSDASGEFHSSQREKIKYMREWGYEEAGDPVGGARKDHTLKHTAISAPGLGLRTSTAERRRA